MFNLPSLAVIALRIRICNSTAICLRFDPSSQPDYFTNDLLLLLQRRKGLIACNILAILPILLEHEGQRLERLLEQHIHELISLEGPIGMTAWSSAQMNENESQYEQLTKKLHECRAHGINLEYLQGIELQFATFSKAMLGVLEDLQAQLGMSHISVESEEVFLQFLGHHTSRARMRDHIIDQLKSRTQTQINAVSHEQRFQPFYQLSLSLAYRQ